MKYTIGLLIGMIGASAAFALIKVIMSGEGTRTGTIFLIALTVVSIVILYLLADHRLDGLFK